MWHHCLKSLFLRKQLRRHSWGIPSLSQPGFQAAPSTLWFYLAQRHRACSHFASPPLPLLQVSTWPWLPKVSPALPSYSYSEEFWCPNGIFLFLHWRQEDSAGDNCVPWLCSKWEILLRPRLSSATARVLRTVFLSKRLLGWLLFCME